MGREGIHPNQLKYIKAPTIEQIKRVIKAYDIDEVQFARFFGIGEGFFIWHILAGYRKLPIKHWHIIYECLKLLDEGKPLPIYKEDIPKAPEDKRFISLFKKPKIKRTIKKEKVKRTGSVCELC